MSGRHRYHMVRGKRVPFTCALAFGFIECELRNGRTFPTQAQIAAFLGYRHSQNAEGVLAQLKSHGLLRVADRVPTRRAGRRNGWAYTYAVAP